MSNFSLTDRSFRPGPRAMNWLIATTLLAVMWALYVRYVMVENSVVGLTCGAGMETFLCHSRKVIITLFGWSVFGGIALAAAVVQFIRPTVVVFGIGLAFAGIGLVLYNNVASAVAAMLLLLSLARPGPRTA
ncbi:hypothetical protein ACLBXM_12950 [Xanthobacteraceae bacterium A53D]